VSRLRRLLRPRSIAVVGGRPAERVVRECRRLGFSGPIWPVHPSRDELGGERCVRDLDDLPEAPDAVFVGVNRHATIDVVRRLAAMDAGGALCYASGYAESGEHDLQRELVDAAGEMAILGPNCYGLINALDGVALWPDEHGCAPVERGVGIVSQSGNVGLNLTLQTRGLPVAALVTVGNQASLGTEDVLEEFLDDGRISAVGLFVEALRDPVRFAGLARRAHASGVPIVVLPTGRSDAGAAIAASHTASLAGNREAYAALYARCGVGVVDTPAELLESLALLDAGGPLTGSRIVSLSCSGGEASLVADIAETRGLRFDAFPDAQRERIAATLTELVSIANPFDYHTFMWGDREAMHRTFSATLDGPQDATMLVLDAPVGEGSDASTWAAAAAALADAAATTGRRAVVVATLVECVPDEVRRAARGLPVLHGLAEGLAALAVAGQIGATRPSDTDPAVVMSPVRVNTLDEAVAKDRLAAVGVPVPRRIAADRRDLPTAAAHLCGPLAVKALGVAHKTDSGGVVLGVRGDDDLARAAASMPTDRLLVEEMVAGAVAEVLVTLRRAAPVGWTLTLGAGGTLTELWRDTVTLICPVSRADVDAALARLRTAPLLHGYRGRPRADVESLLDLVMSLQSLVGTSVVEVELNPVIVTTSGAVAVDALWIEEER
jgi:acyl-CoA synthetase (NDP forming)